MTIEQIISAFKSKRILVIGDVMIDAYMIGKVNRISPEAPVPIVSLESEENRLGGAANVALNLQSLGAIPVLCAVVGSDKQGQVFKQLLQENQLTEEGVLVSSNRCTTVKTRVIGNSQQLLRIDSEDTHAISEQEETAFIQKITQIISSSHVDAVIFEDYNKGLLTKRVIQELIACANSKGIPTTVDPKKDNFLAYKNVTLFKPNLKELKEGIGIDCTFQEKSKFNQAVSMLENQLNNRISFVTLSEHGVYIKDNKNEHHIPAHIRTIADVSGAGDTVISVATLCLCIGLSLRSIAEISNLAGGLVCEKSGVVSIQASQLIEECVGKEFN